MISTKEFFKEREESQKFIYDVFSSPSEKKMSNLQTLAKPLINNSDYPSLAILEKWITQCFSETYSHCCNYASQCFRSSDPFEHYGESKPPTRSDLNNLHSAYYNIYILRQEALLKSYDNLRKFISYKNPIKNGSGFLDYLFPFGESPTSNIKKDFSSNQSEVPQKNTSQYGLSFILSNKQLAILDDRGKINIHVNKKDFTDATRYLDSRISALNEDEKAILSKITEISSLSKINLNAYNKQKHPLLQLSTLELFQLLKGKKTIYKSDNFNKKVNSRPKKIFETHCKTFSFNRDSYLRYKTEFNLIRQTLQIPGIDCSTNTQIDFRDSKMLPVDRFYCRFQYETLLGTELSEAIFQNIQKYNLHQYSDKILQGLSPLFTLPNTFSRQQIMFDMLEDLNSAIEGKLYDEKYMRNNPNYVPDIPEDDEELNISTSIEEIYYSIGDYFAERNLISDWEPLSDEEIISKALDSWIETCTDTCFELKYGIFPIINSFFFHTLWNSVRPFFNTNGRSNSAEYTGELAADEKCATTLFKLLNHFLNSPSVLETYFNFDSSVDTIKLRRQSLLNELDHHKTTVSSKRSYIKRNTYDIFHHCILANNINQNEKCSFHFAKGQRITKSEEVLFDDIRDYYITNVGEKIRMNSSFPYITELF